MSDPLKKLREKIDAIDLELVRLVGERAALAQEIGHLKNAASKNAVYRPEREAQVLARVVALNKGPLSSAQITKLFTEIMSLCRSLEEPLSVAYLGPQGTFSEQAVQKRFGGEVLALPCASIDDVFRAVETGAAGYGMVPVENSTEGAVGRTLDLLLQSPLKVCGEVPLAVHQFLLAKKPDADLAKIKTVYSHPQSFAQCHTWLAGHLPNALRVHAASNAEAAQLAAAHKNSAAVAGKQAASLSGLAVRAEHIEDDPKNTTRFLVVAQHDAAKSGKDKTSLVMSVKNQPGAVHDLLTPLAQHGVSMTRLESRPSRLSGTGLWEYVFYVDIEGHQQDPKVAAALAELKQKAAFLKILGSYPASS